MTFASPDTAATSPERIPPRPPEIAVLRAASHYVVAIAEAAPAAEDSVVLDLAPRDQRVVLTEDKDFGRVSGLPRKERDQRGEQTGTL